ncbi:MAG: hypothetical protein AB8G11_25365 [Saprospiraceae bacterium]
MKNLSIIITILTILIGCTPTIERRVSEIPTEKLPIECKELNEIVNNVFFYLPKKDYYIHLTSSEHVFVDTDCITKLSPQEIKLIFGKPTFETEKAIYYRLTAKEINGRVMYALIFHKKDEIFIEKAELNLYQK